MTTQAVGVDGLPLHWRTPSHWAPAVLRDPLALLGDHAYLERKAAGNALELLNRWPQGDAGPLQERWVAVMCGIARDESEHLAQVTRLLSRRGGRLPRSHSNPYANALRDLVRKGQGRDELMDRLLVSALIEARSCERFCLLSRAAGDDDLARLYRGLFASEHGHYRVFVDLAIETGPPRAVEARWHHLLALEADIIQSQSPGPHMHSGLPQSPPAPESDPAITSGITHEDFRHGGPRD